MQRCNERYAKESNALNKNLEKHILEKLETPRKVAAGGGNLIIKHDNEQLISSQLCKTLSEGSGWGDGTTSTKSSQEKQRSDNMLFAI